MRRRTKDPEFSLFAFLAVLVPVMGTLMLIITGMTQIGLAAPRQRVEIEPAAPTKKSAVYVECKKDGVLIHPDDPAGDAVFVADIDLDSPESAFYALVMRLQNDSTRYLQLLVRQDGVETFNRVRAAIADTGIDIGYDPLFGDGAVQFHRKVVR